MNYSRTAMTLDDIRQRVPSAFATEPFSDRSARYTYVPTIDVIEGMQRAGYGVFGAVQCKSRDVAKREHTKHMIRFRTEQETILGESFPEVVMVNSHDGSSAYKLLAGIFRMVCSNGMIAGDIHDSISIRHQGDIIAEVVEGSNRIAARAPMLAETVRQWSGLLLTAGEQQAFAESAHTVRFADSEGKVNTPIQAAQLLMPRRNFDTASDLWHVHNRVQENVIKGGLSARHRDEQGHIRRVSTRRVNGIDQDVRLNSALWQLSQRMAELKGVSV